MRRCEWKHHDLVRTKGDCKRRTMSSASRQKKKKKNKFGATSPPFIDYLKEILRRYPDGGQILKELIQNADDAGASNVVFIHDERHYGTHSLWTEELGKYQGPALYAFNDAAFTEEDWEGIQRVGRSIKQDDPTKVGRFGIGFNSVYHITDLPCVFSSEHLAIFDPQKKMFGEDEEGYRWSLNDEEDRESLLNLRDQFQPFQNIVSQVNSCSWEKVISKEQYFKGTLFRFPLRNEASEISDNLYDSTKVTQLFDSFIADADISLLFLRNVSSISLLHIDTNGLCNNRLKVSVSNNFITDLSHIRQESFDRKTCFKTVSHISQQMEETRTQWLVTTCLLKQGYMPEIDSLANKLSFYPQVDGAFQLDEDRSLCNGRLSCFLPLPNNEPNKTALPIHINACFGLTDNRRFIKWQEEDQKNDESAMWNELLTKEILPHVYLMMILDAIQLSENSALASRTVYNLWPDLSQTVHKERWHKVATDTLKGLFIYKIFHLADDEQIWVSASDAVFPVNNIHSDTMSAVSRLLIAEGEKLVTVPEHVLKDVQVIFPKCDTLTWVTPSYVRDVLHRSQAENLSKDDKYTLLEFALSDEKYTELQGLKLLPLSDGTFTSFGSGVQNLVLIDNEKFPRTLLPFCKERFLPNNLSHCCTTQLRELATRSMYNIVSLDAQHVVALMKKNLPMDWKMTQGHVTWKTAEDHHPPKSWLSEFWKFLSTEWNDLSSFIDMPLIPLEPLQNSGTSILLASLEFRVNYLSPELLQTEDCSAVLEQLHHVPHSQFKELCKDECEELQGFLQRGIRDSRNKNQHVRMLKSLPLFETISGKRERIDLHRVVFILNSVRHFRFPELYQVAKCDSIFLKHTPLNLQLAECLNIQILDDLEFCVQFILPSVHMMKEATLLDFMQLLVELGPVDDRIVSALKEVRFIRDIHGTLQVASFFYDYNVRLYRNCLTTSSFPVLGQLLLCDNMKDVEKTLANHGIHNSGHKEEGHGSLPKPGCCIPEEWHDCLDMNFLNNFESGEYVGFSKDGSSEYFYAIVIERADDPLAQTRQFPARYKIQVGSDDFIEVSSLDLYQFKREKKATVSKGSTCTDIERLLTSRPPPKTVFPETLEEIKREIDHSLNEIWKMSSEDKQKALKRLYLRWHPDKNPGNETLATEAFKYLQNRIEELEQGKDAHSTSSNWRDFRDFYNMWNTEARSHRRGRERFYQNYSRRHYNFWSNHRETPRPNREEAKRWYEQAQCDIKAAQNDTGGHSSEWCLFKVHQAVEKALIAAIYRGNGHHPNNCSITTLALQVSHFSSQLSSIPSTVRQLTDLGVDGKKTQYPNYHKFPHIPNKQFGIDNARRALDIATNLLEKIEEYIS
ncbi:hypothetical protein Q8A67_007141 [Cirrhinus molitorella]|uniref:Sacsin n=1 Tax=Cirrhinus molitorella TaxID=172907 RepID=A0AA88Q3B2_9TELE|nr:hypothetical protein Q8A67_007141 [Cirrhinus molitorella]